MSLVRIRHVVPLEGFRVRLTLTDGSTLERDVSSLLIGPVFEAVRRDRNVFRQVRVERGTLVWPGEADLCPDVLIWKGSPPEKAADALDQGSTSPSA
jgi:hypothetical protein